MIALLDSDIFVYRIAHAAKNEDSLKAVQRTVQTTINNLLLFDLDVDDYELHLTDGKNNFRNAKAVTVPYKGERKSEKPRWYDEIREYMVNEFEATIHYTIEADDMLAIRATELGEDESIIVSLDKDLDQVQGWHYNFVKQEKYYVDYPNAILNLAKQFLTGDRVDNIRGVKGIGPVKAQRLLGELTTWEEMWEVIEEKLGTDRAIENGHLLYMLRTRDDEFSPTNKHLRRIQPSSVED